MELKLPPKKDISSFGLLRTISSAAAKSRAHIAKYARLRCHIGIIFHRRRKRIVGSTDARHICFLPKRGTPLLGAATLDYQAEVQLGDPRSAPGLDNAAGIHRFRTRIPRRSGFRDPRPSLFPELPQTFSQCPCTRSIRAAELKELRII